MMKTYLSLMRKQLRIFYDNGRKEIQFHDGRYITDCPVAQDAIETHIKFNSSVFLQDNLEEAQPNPPLPRKRASQKKQETDEVLEEFLGEE